MAEAKPVCFCHRHRYFAAHRAFATHARLSFPAAAAFRVFRQAFLQKGRHPRAHPQPSGRAAAPITPHFAGGAAFRTSLRARGRAVSTPPPRRSARIWRTPPAFFPATAGTVFYIPVPPISRTSPLRPASGAGTGGAPGRGREHGGSEACLFLPPAPMFCGTPGICNTRPPLFSRRSGFLGFSPGLFAKRPTPSRPARRQPFHRLQEAFP